MRGARVVGGRSGRRRIGKVLRAVFHPQTFNLVGYLVKQPDLLLMFKRGDRFLAYDSFRVVDGRIVGTTNKDSWDELACKRLGIDFDTCLLLEGMPLITAGGTELGSADSVEYDERTGKTKELVVTGGVAAKALLGEMRIPKKLLVKYHEGSVVVSNEVLGITAEGGLAAKAGEGVAIASSKLSEVGEQAGKVFSKTGKAASKALSETGKTASKALSKTGKVAGRAVNKGAYSLGRQLSRSKGMFAAFKEEYDKEVKKKK
jgi:uncharacterized protein YrrD